MPQNTYMSVASDNIALESAYAKHLHEEIKRNGMMPCGDYLCEVLTQFPVHQANRLIYKIQVPVQRTNDRIMLRGSHFDLRGREVWAKRGSYEEASVCSDTDLGRSSPAQARAISLCMVWICCTRCKGIRAAASAAFRCWFRRTIRPVSMQTSAPHSRRPLH